jgi:hypothetical protein
MSRPVSPTAMSPCVGCCGIGRFHHLAASERCAFALFPVSRVGRRRLPAPKNG